MRSSEYCEPRRCGAPTGDWRVRWHLPGHSNEPVRGRDHGAVYPTREAAEVTAARLFDLEAAHEGGGLEYVIVDDAVCGAVATEERMVEGVVCHLCAEHAAELDAQRTED